MWKGTVPDDDSERRALEAHGFARLKARSRAPVDDVVGGGVYRWRSVVSRTGSGVLGNPEAASAEKGERLFDAISTALADKLCNAELWALPWE